MSRNKPDYPMGEPRESEPCPDCHSVQMIGALIYAVGDQVTEVGGELAVSDRDLRDRLAELVNEVVNWGGLCGPHLAEEKVAWAESQVER